MSKEQRNVATALISPAGGRNVQASQKRSKCKKSVLSLLKACSFSPKLSLPQKPLFSYLHLKKPANIKMWNSITTPFYKYKKKVMSMKGESCNIFGETCFRLECTHIHHQSLKLSNFWKFNLQTLHSVSLESCWISYWSSIECFCKLWIVFCIQSSNIGVCKNFSVIL